MKKQAIVLVVNDLVTDRRVDRTCRALMKCGFGVLLVGRKLKESPPVDIRPYLTKRMKLLTHRGPLFYAEFNIRLFVLLLFKKVHLIVSNDLDTLLPSFIIHKLRGVPLVYDTHEYFTAVPELANRPLKRKIWQAIEAFIFPRLKDVITVNDSIAAIYHEKYGNQVAVVRNIPMPVEEQPASDLLLPGIQGKHVVLLQGAGINIDRGAEEAIDAMRWVENAVLLIVGGGDVMELLKSRVLEYNLENKIFFIPRQSPGRLRSITRQADLGLSLDKDTNLNYRFSLPNKLFDYIHAGVPVLASRLPELEKIIKAYDIGDFIDNHDPGHIAQKVNFILQNQQLLERWKKNLENAARDLSWEKEEPKLLAIFAIYA